MSDRPMIAHRRPGDRRLVAGIVLVLLGLALLAALALYWGGWIESGAVTDNALFDEASSGLDEMREGATEGLRKERRHA